MFELGPESPCGENLSRRPRPGALAPRAIGDPMEMAVVTKI